MLIRIKFEGKSRKLADKVSTVADLKRKIGELFGTPTQQLDVVYKDCDGEIVNVMDDEDLKNCYNEANELKLNSLTFIVKSKEDSKSRSPRNAKDRANNPDADGRMAGGPSNGGSGRGGGIRDYEGETQNLKQTLIKMKFLAKSCIQNGVEDPLAVLRSALSAVEKDCSGLAYNPVLLAKTFACARGDLVQAIKRGYQEAVANNPELLAVNDECERHWREFKHARRDRQKRKYRNDSESEENSDKGASKQPQQSRADSRGGVEKDPPQVRSGDRVYGSRDPAYDQDSHHSRYSHKKYQYYEQDRSHQHRPKDHHKEYRQDNRRYDDTAHDKVMRLCRRFKNKDISELKAIVNHNPDKSLSQLEAIILQSRKSKSSYY